MHVGIIEIITQLLPIKTNLTLNKSHFVNFHQKDRMIYQIVFKEFLWGDAYYSKIISVVLKSTIKNNIGFYLFFIK